MDIVIESVKRLEQLLNQSGCDDGGVRLDVSPDMIPCRFEKGASMVAEFGSVQGVFTTYDPIRACTKISFMFGAPLETENVRGAAAAIINVASGFFCLARTLRPCEASSHTACGAGLERELAGERVYIFGTLHGGNSLTSVITVDTPALSSVILISGEGLIAPGAGDLVEQYRDTKRIICIGPSTAGIARLHNLEQWCPYGRS